MKSIRDYVNVIEYECINNIMIKPKHFNVLYRIKFKSPSSLQSVAIKLDVNKDTSMIDAYLFSNNSMSFNHIITTYSDFDIESLLKSICYVIASREMLD